MKNKYVLDTNIISALVFEKDFHRKKALELYESLPEDSTFITPSSVLLEFVVGVKKIMPKKTDYALVLAETIVHRVVRIDSTFVEGYKDFLRDEKLPMSLKATDLSVLYLSIAEEAELLTFDKKLEKEYKILK